MKRKNEFLFNSNDREIISSFSELLKNNRLMYSSSYLNTDDKRYQCTIKNYMVEELKKIIVTKLYLINLVNKPIDYFNTKELAHSKA